MIPHFDIPFRFVNRTTAVANQDSDREVMNCVETIVRYQHGDRPERPVFGVPDFTFELPGIEIPLIQESIREQEPRSNVQVTDPVIEELIQTIVIRRPPQ